MWHHPIVRSVRSVRQFKYSHGERNFERPGARSAYEVTRDPPQGGAGGKGRRPSPSPRGSDPGGIVVTGHPGRPPLRPEVIAKILELYFEKGWGYKKIGAKLNIG